MDRGSSPASRGAAGAYIEGELGALYLLALLTGNRAPGMPDARVISVRFQGVEHGFQLDDLIAFGRGAAGDSVLEIQSKRDITFSPGDTVYREVASQIARSVVGSVPADRHLLGIATQRTSRKISGAYQDVLKWSRTTENAAAFFTRLGARGIASKDMRDFVDTTRKHLVAGGIADDHDAIWRLLRRMLILEFDFEAASPITRTYGHALARMALAGEDVGRAEALWSRLVDLSIKTGTTGGEIDQMALVVNLNGAGFRLAGGREYDEARIKLAELAQNTLAHIGGSLAGVSLPRLESVAAVDDAFEAHRFVQVRGDPGVGKSWVLRHLAERVALHAPIIFLDREATPPGGWLHFSNALGIPGLAVEFLNDLAASGGAMIFIDGIDMFDDVGRQRTIAELIRAASAIPDFKVIATTRTAVNADIELWLDDQIITAMGGVHQVMIEPLSEDEVATLIDQAPDLRTLLDPKHPAAGLARNLYRLSRLVKAHTPTGMRTEAAMAGFWWRSADGAPANEVRAAQRLMAALAASALKCEVGLEIAEDSAARSHLIGAQTLREVGRDWLEFYHDVLRDWAIGSYIAERPQRLSDLDLSVPVSPRVARGIEFSARFALETCEDCRGWIQLLELLSVSGAHGSWRRQAILALSRSEAGYELLEKCSAGLLANDGALLVELCTTIAAVETVATADLLVMSDGTRVDLPRSYRTDVAGSSLKVMRWVVAHASEISMAGIGAVVELVKIQIPLHEHLPLFARQSAVILFGWLRQLDVDDADVTIPDERNLGRAASDWRSRMIEQLRLIALLLGKFAPHELKAYLREVGSERDSYKVDEIRRFSKVIAPIAPAELSELVLGSLLQTRKRPERRRRIMEQAFTFADSSYLPASPAQPPFLDLLESAPAEGLNLIRTLVAEAIAFSNEARTSAKPGFTIYFGDRPRFFPRIDSYLWSRDQCREYSAASGLKALEAWSQQRLDDETPVDEVLADILGPEGSCAAYVLVAVDVLLSHISVARDALAPFIATPEILAIDYSRWRYDLRPGIDQLNIGKEPQSKVRLADLRARPSRNATLFQLMYLYLGDDPVANRLREQLGAAVVSLEPIQPYSNWDDVRFIARVANNRLQRSNWAQLGDGKLEYRPPADEVAHLEVLKTQRVASVRSAEIEALISLAINGDGKYATALTARHASAYAQGDLPDDSDTDFLKSRSTRLIATALLVARDGDDSLFNAEEAWVRKVVAIALDEHSDRSIGSKNALDYNRPAIAVLTLIHLWSRKKSLSDRNVLIRLATREDHSAAPAFSAGLGQILKVAPNLLKSAMRAAFASLIWRWKSDEEEDETEHMRFGVQRAAAIDAAVAAEIAWLDGESEPAWPAWPEERPHLRRGSSIQVSGLIKSLGLDEDEAIKSTVAEPSSSIHINSKAAAQWLEIVRAAPKGLGDWRQEVVEAYVGWTARMNGVGLTVDIEIENGPHDWNLHYYALFAERLLDSADVSFEADMKLVTDLPDMPFGEVAQIVIRSVDTLYCDDKQRSATRPAELRSCLANRVMALQRWRNAEDPASSRIDMQSGGIIAKMMVNTYSSFSGTYCYLSPSQFDCVDPLLPAIRPLLPGGPTAFVALCTMNLLLVSTRVRHLDFLLEATEAWFGRTQAPALWIDLGIGRKVVQWLEAAVILEPELLSPSHPLRVRIDCTLGKLVGVGVAEAHDLELRVEAAASMRM